MARILCVDDDVDVLETCRVLLKEEGYSVDTAGSAKDGLAKARQHRPDLVIMDVMMEDITAGFHAVYGFRQDDKLKYVPILMLTSINQKLNMGFNPDKDGEYLPVDEFLEKPIIRDRLVTSVTKLLNLPKEKINVEGRVVGKKR